MKVTFKQKIPVAKNIYTFQFQPDHKVEYEAGQFIRMNLEHDNPDERGVSHFFTVSASPTEDYLANTTKFSEPSSTFKQTLQKLQPGDKVTMSQPEGDFTLPKDKDKKIVFVAGGIGVTPYRSMIKYLVDSGEERSIHLIYGAKVADEFAFRDLFDGTGWLKATYVVSEPTADWKGETGQLSGEKIKELAGGFDDKLIYLSGPEPMVESFEKQLQDIGLAKKQIVTDFFPGYNEI